MAYDPVGNVDHVSHEVKQATNVDELLCSCDMLTLHVPLNGQTTAMIGERELSLLGPGAILVNTARSPIVEEAALINALRDGRLHAAGLDLTGDKPLPIDHPLLGLDNVVLTPHVGGSTEDALTAVALRAVDNALSFLAGDPPDPALCVNPDVLVG